MLNTEPFDITNSCAICCWLLCWWCPSSEILREFEEVTGSAFTCCRIGEWIFRAGPVPFLRFFRSWWTLGLQCTAYSVKLVFCYVTEIFWKSTSAFCESSGRIFLFAWCRGKSLSWEAMRCKKSNLKYKYIFCYLQFCMKATRCNQTS